MLLNYVMIAKEALETKAELELATTKSQFQKLLHSFQPDMVHLFGAWSWQNAVAAFQASRCGVRYVVTPFCQLEPWVMQTRHWHEKMPKRLLFQKRLLTKAYAIISMSDSERTGISRLGWNQRIEVVENPQTTTAITAEEMGHQLIAIYRKVLDSNLMERMQPATIQAIPCLIKVGLTSNGNWLSEEEKRSCSQLSLEEWDKLLLYSQQEHFFNTILTGTKILQLHVPEVNIEERPCYYPDHWKDHRTDMGDYSLRLDDANIIRHLKTIIRQAKKNQLTIHDIIEYASALYHASLTEDKLQEKLRNEDMTKDTASIMAVLQQLTDMDEGMMPLVPSASRLSKKVLRNIQNHLAI